ncbi:MAG: enoyl-CoA hydratase/isomerase family protein, partial [Nitriliruptoraceae bacterium]
MSDPVTRFHLTYADRPVGRLAIMTMDNGEDHTKPNTFGAEALQSLSAALEELETADDVAGLLLTGKPFIFAVGADLKSFTGIDTDTARQAGELGHAVFARLQALPFPTVAAINGACIGGGLEIALHCDARTMSSGAQVVAFSEVGLSMLPAWGGTQLAPRSVGVKDA